VAKTQPTTTTATASTSQLRDSGEDLLQGLADWRVWTFLSWRDVANRYQRSFIGPLWLTITTAIFLTAIGIIYSQLFNQDVSTYLPYLASGVIAWLAFAALLMEMSSAYTSSIHFVLNLPGPKSVYLFRVLLRNLIVLAHNLPVWIAVALLFHVPLSWATFLVIPGLAIAFGALFFIGAALSIISAKVRDTPVILAALLQVLFFVTPVMWGSELLKDNSRFVLKLNPLVPLLDLVRQPLLGQVPGTESYVAAVLILVLSALIGVITFVFYRRRLAFWL
jgi:lipopolysaccharide transport system permease protein